MSRLLTALAGAALLSGCGMISGLFREPVPTFETAEAQYQYAEDVILMTDPIPPEQRSMSQISADTYITRYRDRDYRRFIRAYEAVVDRFPDDLRDTPQAKLRLGEFHFQLEEYGDAAALYRDVLDRYADDDILQAGALYGLGSVSMARFQYNDADHHYRRLIERFGTSSNSAIVVLVRRAAERRTIMRYRSGT